MRVLQIARRFVADEWGGTETVIAEMSQRLVKMGHDTEVWASSALSQPGDDWVAGVAVKRFGYHYPVLGLDGESRLALDKKGGNLVSWPMMAALVARSNVDIYHLHAIKRLGAQAALAARWRRKPYVVTLHGGYLIIPAEEQLDLARPLIGRLEWGKVIGAVLGSRSLLKRADAVFCVNPAEVAPLKATLPGTRVEHLPNGVHAEDFENGDGARFRREHGFKNDEILIGCISRIDPQKNQMNLLRAFARLDPLRYNARLLLVGPQTVPAYAAELAARAKTLGLAERVTIQPPLAFGGRELADAYAALDVFALASRHEPFGIVVLEAWSAGTPVVATRVGGLAHLIDDEQDGLLVPENDPAALAAALRRLLDEKQLAARLAEAGHAKVRETYRWEAIVQRLTDVYQDVIEAHR